LPGKNELNWKNGLYDEVIMTISPIFAQKSILVLFAIIVGAFCTNFDGVKQEMELFRNFMTTYQKSYGADEFETRFEIFKANVKKIEEHNRSNPNGARWGVNQFTDMTEEEFQSYPCGVKSLAELNDLRPDFEPNFGELPEVQDLPESWDWTTKGAVTPVKNQGQCGKFFWTIDESH
jgi:C1A family cysteine protease